MKAKKPDSPWLPELPPESAWKNPTQDKRFTEIPSLQGIQTFGLGYVFKGVISRFSKSEKEKKKLIRIREENYKARSYAGLVHDPEVKGKIMDDYALTEEEYYQLLARFNESNKDIVYKLESHEVVALLILFFTENKKK